jgi:hypothetical protein
MHIPASLLKVVMVVLLLSLHPLSAPQCRTWQRNCGFHLCPSLLCRS